MNQHISPAVRDFINLHIESFDSLEVLLLLFDQRDKEWTLAAVSKALALNEPAVESRLVDLKTAGTVQLRLVDGQKLYRFFPASADTARVVEDLARSYTTYPVRIVNLIFTRPISKVRTFPEALKKRQTSG